MEVVMKNKKILAILLILFIGVSFLAADACINKNATGLYGFLWSNNGGGGIQYHRWFNNWLGGQITFGGWCNTDEGILKNLDYSVFGEVQFKFHQFDASDKFGGCLYGWILAGHHGYYSSYDDNEFARFNALLGIGLGFETVFFEHLSIPFQFGYSGAFPYDTNFGFSAGIGIRYRF